MLPDGYLFGFGRFFWEAPSKKESALITLQQKFTDPSYWLRIV
jgi:hypothetical protein